MTQLPSRLLIGQHQASLPERLLVRERHAVRREPCVAGREAAGLLGVGAGRAGDYGIQLMAVRRPVILQQVFATTVCNKVNMHTACGGLGKTPSCPLPLSFG